MSRVVVILDSKMRREQASRWCLSAPPLTRVTFAETKRSVPQNDLMWSLLTELAKQLDWHGQRYSPDDWKDYMMHALRRARWMPSEDGGLVPIGMRTSELTKAEFGELIELIQEFGARHGVTFKDDQTAEAAKHTVAA